MLSGSAIFGSGVILVWNNISVGSEHLQRTETQRRVRAGPSFARAYLRPDGEMTERPERFLDRNQRWLPCSNRKSFSSLTFSGHMLCCSFIGVWSNTVHTQAAHTKSETSPVTGNQKNMFEAVCLESTEFLCYFCPIRKLVFVFHRAHTIAFFHVAFKPKKIASLVMRKSLPFFFELFISV